MESINSKICERYVIKKHIGHGGMADVYLAHDEVLDRDVAIKMLRKDMLLDPVALLRFKHEAAASSKLIHPNIIEIYDVNEYKEHQFIVMEYVSGLTLKQVIANRTQLSVNEAVSIVIQLANAIGHAHKQKVIHRDIKPQNIIVKADGTIKILDFGIAQFAESLQLTSNHAVMGSIHYLAPEVLNGDIATNQSDIYSIGIVLFELLTGIVPFKDEHLVNIALKHINNRLPNINDYNKDIPKNICNIVYKATAKKLNDRYYNSYELYNDLLNPNNMDNYINPDDNIKITKNRFGFNNHYNDNINNNSNRRFIKKNISKKLYYLITSMITIIAIILLTGILILTGTIQLEDKKVVMPNIINLDINEAKDILAEFDLDIDELNIRKVLTIDTPKGEIIDCNIKQGDKISKGSSIMITISDGIAEIMDDYIGKDIDYAINKLSAFNNLRIIEKEIFIEGTPGEIINQTSILPNEPFNPTLPNEITFEYIGYKTIVLDHNIINNDLETVKSDLNSKGIKVIISELNVNELTSEELIFAKSGIVIRTHPSTGSSFTQKKDNNVILYYINDVK